MISYDRAYQYGCVVRFNMNPVVPGKGSAIFLHVGESPTLGCVAMPERNLLPYLRILEAQKRPQILIFSPQRFKQIPLLAEPRGGFV